MTNKEASIAVIGFTADDSIINKSFADSDLNPDDTYDKLNSAAIDMVAITVLVGLLQVPDVREGGFLRKYDRNSILKLLDYLYKRNNMINPLSPVVESKPVW